jgi:polysaccharide export outer membrane protein
LLVVSTAVWWPAALLRAAQADKAPVDYVVGQNDVLAVMVIDQAPLTGKFIVRADGTFVYPLLGNVKASGLTLQAIEDQMRAGLAKGYLKDPQVSVSVDQYRSQQIFVMGEVRQPGVMQFTGTMTLVEALARAGSTTEHAGSDAVVIRSKNGIPVSDAVALASTEPRPDAAAKDADIIHANLEFLRTGAVTDNISLKGGDTIFVPRAPSVFISGEVRSPGEFTIRTGMTVREALALAGGVIERGSTRRIQVIRLSNGVRSTKSVNLNDLVQAGDNIVVRPRLF